MSSEPTNIALLVVGVFFVAFLLFKLFRPSAARAPEWHEARRKIVEAKKRARDKNAEPSQTVEKKPEPVAVPELDPQIVKVNHVAP